MLDHRRTARRKTFLGGRVVYNHRQSTCDCIVKDMGDTGAKLVFAHPTMLPDEFDIQVARLERSFRARVTWRGRLELGVQFVGARPEGNVVPLDQALRIRRLEADKAALERRLAELTVQPL